MIRVLSLFDGISAAAQALKELGINHKYYASEIDKFSIQISKKNHPDIIQIGDIKGIEFEDDYIFYNQNNDPMRKGGSFRNNIYLLIGGSPCQDLSCAKRDGKGLDGDRSNLFYEYLRILKEARPKYFILENVASMKKEAKNIITKELFGIEPIIIDSALLTAQMRKRFYWVGVLQKNGTYKKAEIQQPEDKRIFLKDIIENGYTDRLKSYCITATYSRACPKDYFIYKQRQLIYTNPDGMVRKLTPTECERLQGFPDNYADCVSNTQRYKALGNSFTVPVIKYILKNLIESLTYKNSFS